MSDTRHPQLLSAEHTGLFVVDIQERFRAVIPDFDEMLHASIRMVRTFRLLKLPIVVTEQYPQGLGSTVPEMREALGSAAADTKMTFSCGSCESTERMLGAGQCRQVVICGIESHVCVQQSVYDLMHRGLQAYVPVDAVASRRVSDRDWALRRMARAGATLSTTESMAFELLENAKHPQFKAVQALFK